MTLFKKDTLPDSHSPNLTLSHPTPEECTTIWTNTSASWGDSFPLPLHLKESQYMTTAPLARNSGMTIWILVDKNHPPEKRQILSSCETFRKQALTSDAKGNVTDTVVHGIASVFCPLEYRCRGYPKRMMRELARILSTWQSDGIRCVGSILYSDIGKRYYAKLGWHPNISNSHVEFKPQPNQTSPLIKSIQATDLPSLCKRDEALLQRQMATPTPATITRVGIIPDQDHMGWHHAKEDFACEYLFGKTPLTKGAIAGSPGSQVWAIWTHRYYGRHDVGSSNNVLYILRLVVELDETGTRVPADAERRPQRGTYDEQLAYLQAVLQAAQTEAFEWKLDAVKLWDPTPLVRNMLTRIGIEYEIVEREEESIASGMWYDEQGGISEVTPLLVNNEHYAWL